MDNLEICKRIKTLMKSHGAQTIYINKYKTMRSVKCYRVNINETKLKQDIGLLMSSLDVINYEFHVIRNKFRYCDRSSFIVRVQY